MNLRRIFSALLALLMLTAPLSSVAEGFPFNPMVGAAPVQTGTIMEDVLQIFVEYDEENAEWDGKLDARVKVSWKSSDGNSAKDVKLLFETEDGLKLSKGEESLELGDIEVDSAAYVGIELEFDPSVERPDYVPEPTLRITASGSNTLGTIYTCKLDGTTEPRAMVVGCDPDNKSPLGTPVSVAKAVGFFTDSYYNRQKTELVFEEDPSDFFSFLEQMAAWEPDRNDITYLYLSAHGVYQEKTKIVIPAFAAFVPEDYAPTINGVKYSGEQIVGFHTLLNVLNGLNKGKWVLIADTCFSGNFIPIAEGMGMDPERYTIVTSTDSTHEAVGAGATAFTDTLEKLPDEYADENGCVTAKDLWSHSSDTFSETLTFILPQIGGDQNVVISCSNPEYDDGKRLLTVIEETVEYVDPLEMYYAYLREWVVPEIGLARRDDRFTGKKSWDWDEVYWAELLFVHGFSGLLSAAVCDLDQNGSLDMITLSVMPREQALIEATNVFYSVNLEMYQIENGQVVRSDLREDVLYIGEEANGIWSKMECWLTEFEDQTIFKAHCFSTPGMSGVGDWAHSFDCTFEDGKIVDGAPSTYRAGYEVRTESGEVYLTPDYDDDVFEHMGDGVAAVEACYATMQGAQYNAADATNLYNYIYEYEEPRVFEPLKLISVQLQASRKDEVKASIKQSVEAAMKEAGMTAYSHGISCNRDTEEFRQSIIYSDEWDYKAVDTEKMRAVALAILTAAEVNAPQEVVSAMRNFEFAKKNQIEWEGSDWKLTFMMIPDGTYSFVIDCYE